MLVCRCSTSYRAAASRDGPVRPSIKRGHLGRGRHVETKAVHQTTTTRSQRPQKITAEEVSGWFGVSAKAVLPDSEYLAIATELNTWRVFDGSAPDVKVTKVDEERLWDIHAAIGAVKTLEESIPRMLAYVNNLFPYARQARDREAIEALRDALAGARHFVEWPLGEYKRRRRFTRQKEWHTPAIVIARKVVDAMDRQGIQAPGISRNSIVVRVVANAVRRLQFEHAEMITNSAIAVHLARWDKKFGWFRCRNDHKFQSPNLWPIPGRP